MYSNFSYIHQFRDLTEIYSCFTTTLYVYSVKYAVYMDCFFNNRLWYVYFVFYLLSMTFYVYSPIFTTNLTTLLTWWWFSRTPNMNPYQCIYTVWLSPNPLFSSYIGQCSILPPMYLHWCTVRKQLRSTIQNAVYILLSIWTVLNFKMDHGDPLKSNFFTFTVVIPILNDFVHIWSGWQQTIAKDDHCIYVSW